MIVIGHGLSATPDPRSPEGQEHVPRDPYPGDPALALKGFILAPRTLQHLTSRSKAGCPILICPLVQSRVKLVPKEPEALKVPRVCVVSPDPLALLVLLVLL